MKTAGYAAALLLVLITVAAYWPAIGGDFVWDDDVYVRDNATLRTVDGLRRIWFEPGATPQHHYFPAVHTSLWLEQRLWGLDPAGYHVTNILLHAAVALLLWRVLRRLGAPGAWVAAAVFALHPVQVESVAWITERKNVLSGLFYLGAILAYLRFARPGRPRGEPGSRTAYAWALTLFVLALLSKTVACVLPAVILLLIWWKRGRVAPADVRPLAPFFAAGILLGLLTVWVERRHVGALGGEWELTLVERVLVAGRALWFYAGKLLWPHPLSFIYPKWQIDAGAVWQYLFPAAALAAAVLLWRVRVRTGRAPLTALLVFAGTLFPALGFFNVYFMRYSYVADHFQYLAGPALIALVVGGACRLIARREGLVRPLGSLLAVALLATLGTLTWRQAGIYADLETLYRDTLRKNPGAWMAHVNLGLHLEPQGRRPEAIELFREALRVEPDAAEAHYNLANSMLAEGNTVEALRHFGEALRIRPGYAKAHNNLGDTLLTLGRREEALGHYRRVVAIEPRAAGAHYNLGIALAALERGDEAIASYREALRLDPRHAGAHNNLGLALARRGMPFEALEQYREAARLQPGMAAAHYNAGNLLSSLGRQDEAIEHYRRVLATEPTHIGALNNLGLTLQLRGGVDEAIELYRRSLTLVPEAPRTRNNLGLALAQTGAAAEALAQFEDALRLAPEWPGPFSSAAWILATHPEAALRDADRAVELAERAAALTGRQDAATLDVLAAAYASAGRFDRARGTAAAAIDLAGAGNARATRRRLELYEQGVPYREGTKRPSQ